MRQPYRLKSITLRDIGVFEHTHFDFPPIESVEKDAAKAEIHIFTGPNGCGKSTILYAMAAIFEVAKDNSLIFKRFRNNKSTVDFSFLHEHGRYSVENSSPLERTSDGLKSLKFLGQSSFWSSDSDSVFKNYYGRFDKNNRLKESVFPFAAFAYAGNRSPQGEFNVKAIQNITDSPFEDALSFDKTVRPDILAQWIANNRTKAALAQADNDSEDVKRYNAALLAISDFIQDVCQLNVNFRLKRTPLEVIVDVDDVAVSFDALPEGLKSIISWVADLALRLEDIPFSEQRDIFSQPIILFLDEVDIHLHPKWQRRILPAVQKLLPNAQVFVSTHSPFVVGSVEDAWVYRLPDPQRTVCRDPSVPEKIIPEASAAGKSVQLILEEVFDVSEQFDVETEGMLSDFYRARDAYLKHPANDRTLMDLAEKIRERGEELELIIEMELRQIARRVKG
ncbi:AAA family ATPase [Pantoea agglomerans]|uniref:AAA family ATPase n=1 Tax=Enterobacter agglomerans TaxID=549 RepID=A0ACC5RLP0_ENTAG|nr:ATP-binding protein [Pantoea agglomerans]MBK4725616.1 AAA family ATPase [Pantoea agglomerans]